MEASPLYPLASQYPEPLAPYSVAVSWMHVQEFWWILYALFLLCVEMLPKRRSTDGIYALSAVGFCVALIYAILGVKAGTPEYWLAGSYLADGFSALLKPLFLATGLVATIMMKICETKSPDRRGEFYILPWFAIAAMGVMSSANDFTTLFVALELLTVTFYVLVSLHRSREESLEAGVKYLILGALSSGFLVFGITFIFGMTGTLNFTALGHALENAPLTAPLAFGIFLLFVGLGFKIAAVPFQWWVPDVYEGAPTPVTAMLSVGSKAAGVSLLIRLMWGPFAPVWQNWVPMLSVLAAASIIFGNFGALSQRNVKRMMGYSSISHAGFILLGFVAFTLTGIQAVVFYLMTYAAAALLVFVLLGFLADRLGGFELPRFNGLARTNPALAWPMLIGMVSLAGVPPLGGFMAKWLVLSAAWERGAHVLVGIAVIGAAASLYYYLAIVGSMFFKEPLPVEQRPSLTLDLPTQAVVILLTFLTVFTGIYPVALQDLITQVVSKAPVVMLQ